MWRANALSCSAQLVVVLSFLYTLVPQQPCAANDIRCAPSSSCGKISSITFPFRFKGDPEDCGDQRYELDCVDNVTILQLNSAEFHVEAINYNNYTIRLVDPNIQEVNCSSIPRYFFSQTNFTHGYINEQVYDPTQLRSYGKKIHEYPIFRHIIYLNCSNPVRDDPVYVDTSPCLSRHNSNSNIYAVAGELRVGSLKYGCHVNLVAATSLWPWAFGSEWYDDDIIPHSNTFSYTEIHKGLAYGFELSWLDQACRDFSCPDASSCLFDSDTQTLGCHTCTTPLGFNDAKCRNIPYVRIFAEDYIYGILRGLRQIIGKDKAHHYGLYDLFVSKRAIDIGVITGRFFLPYITARFLFGIIFLFLLLIYTWRTRHISIYANIEDFLQGNDLAPIRYSYKEIKNMTQGFKDKLGEGGYGFVYKGKLRSGPFIAVKMLGKSKANGQDFISEVATIGRIHHANVVRLIGYCVEGSKRALVYEFMPNGSLDKYIFSKENSMISLSFEKIHEISLGVARGIAYLHQGCDMQILHFDIKPHNILLDDKFIPKVSDFGLAKLYPIDDSIITLTAARGTLGYMAPELFYNNIGGVSYKADVYSFGMLLMEMASRRKNLNPHVEHSSQLYFPFWIHDQFNEGKEIEMEDVVNEEENIHMAKKMFLVALWCIQLKPRDRPSMNEVVEMLEGDVDSIDMPPKPSFYPDETITEDLDIDSDQTTTTDYASSTSYLEEATTDPLLKNSA